MNLTCCARSTHWSSQIHLLCLESLHVYGFQVVMQYTISWRFLILFTGILCLECITFNNPWNKPKYKKPLENKNLKNKQKFPTTKKQKYNSKVIYKHYLLAFKNVLFDCNLGKEGEPRSWTAEATPAASPSLLLQQWPGFTTHLWLSAVIPMWPNLPPVWWFWGWHHQDFGGLKAGSFPLSFCTFGWTGNWKLAPQKLLYHQ